MPDITEKEINDAINNCKWRTITCGIPICTGNCAPCAHEIEKGTCDALIKLVTKKNLEDSDHER